MEVAADRRREVETLRQQLAQSESVLQEQRGKTLWVVLGLGLSSIADTVKARPSWGLCENFCVGYNLHARYNRNDA